MLKFFKIALAMIFLCFINIVNVFTKEYEVKGYITSVKIRNTGPDCTIEISETPNGPTYKKGYWTCNNINAEIMFELARTAKIQLFPVIVILDTKGEPDDWVSAIEAK